MRPALGASRWLGLTHEFGCVLPQCGACTVHINGEAKRSCVIPVGASRTCRSLRSRSERTRTDSDPEGVGRHQVPQCGTASGMIMAVSALLAKNPSPTDDELKNGNYEYLPLRTYPRIAPPFRHCSPEALHDDAQNGRSAAFGAAGALVVGYALWPSTRLARADAMAAKQASGSSPTGQDRRDDTVTVVIPHCDMGTGYSSRSQMAAEELDATGTRCAPRRRPADSLLQRPLGEASSCGKESIRQHSRLSARHGRQLFRNHRRVYGSSGDGRVSAIRATAWYGIRIAAPPPRNARRPRPPRRWNVASGDVFDAGRVAVLHEASGRSLASATSRPMRRVTIRLHIAPEAEGAIHNRRHVCPRSHSRTRSMAHGLRHRCT